MISLGLAARNGLMLTPAQMLQATIEEIESGRVEANKGLVILLNDERDAYDTFVRNSGMRMSEGVALMRAAEVLLMHQMGLLP